MANSEVVKLENVSFSYDGKRILENVNLSVRNRDFLWIVGPNGGGKTTLMKIILGLLKPQQGTVEIFGGSPVKGRRKIGYMPQHAQLDQRFPVTAMDVVLMGSLPSGIKPGPYSSENRRAALAALEGVGLGDQAGRTLGELSGGQQRRLLIARALAGNPELLMLDEPTANLDQQIEKELYDLLRRLSQRLTIIMVSHDPAFVSEFVHQVVCVNHTVAIHPTSDMERSSMQEIYGMPMRLVRHDLHDHPGKKK